MKVKVRKILLCVFFALFIVTLFTASFSLGRYSSVQSSESDYDDDFEYTLYDSIVVNTIDEFFAAISNGYNYIIIGDAIKDPLIIAGSMSDIRDDLIIDLNGHEIQRNSRDPLLNVTTGFTLTIIDSEGTGSMYNPVGSVIQVSGGTLTVQNGIFESGPRSDNSRDAKRHNDKNEPDYVDVTAYNEYATGSNESGWNALGGGSISGGTSGTAQVTVYRNSNIGSENTSNTYGDSIGTVALPIITPKATGRGVVNGSMYFDDAEEERIYYTCNEYNVIKDDTYLYYTYEADNMQYSTVADKSTANYYYQYTDSVNFDSPTLVTVYVYNDVKGYANNGYYPVDSSEDNTGFAAVKMQSGNLYVRGGTYYSYFGEENTFGVQSTGGLMSVNPTGSNAINFYAYQNGVCVECTVDTPTKTEMLNISSGNFYSELGDTVRVTNGNLVIGEGKFTKDVSSSDIESEITTDNLQNLTDAELAELYSYNNSVVNISGGKLNINTRATFNVYGSGVTGIRASSKATVNTNNATFNFYGAGNSKLDASFTRGVYTDGGSVTFDGTTNINLAQISVDGQLLTSRYNVGVLAGNDGTVIFNGSSSITVGGNTNPSGGNYGIYSTGGGITCGQDSNSSTTIKIAENSASTGNYGIYSGGGSIATYGKTEITLGNTANLSTSNYGIYSSGGTVTLGAENSQADKATITVNGDSSSSSNFGIQTIGGHIYTYGTTSVTVYGTNSTGVYATVPDTTSASSINISGTKFECYIHMGGNEISSTAVSTEGGQINFDVAGATITSDGFGITASNTIYVDTNDDNVADAPRPVASSDTYNPGLVQLTAPENTTTTPTVGLTSNNGTAIYIYGGELLVNSGITLNVNSTINQYSWETRRSGISTTNGIYIEGGDITSYGNINVKNTVAGGLWHEWALINRMDTTISQFNGIYIDGGSLSVTRAGSLQLTNVLESQYSTTSWGGTSNSTWPTLSNTDDNGNNVNVSGYSGIYVHSGSFTATGTGQITVGEGDNAVKTTGLYVSHQGVENDGVGEGNNANVTNTTAYRLFNIKSYALRIEGQNTTDAQVTILTGSIENSVGGGVYVSNGTVNLGTQQINNSLSVVTTGHEQYQTVGVGGGHMWYYTIPKTGGHAVQVSGGILNIFNGTYTANQGNGIVVNGGTANVHTGTFLGYDQGSDQNQLTGPGASAGLKVIGGNANIFGGSYGKVGNSNSGGAFVMGLSSNQKATVNVLGGTFNATGADTFTIFRYSTVTFDPENKHNTVQNSISNGGAISVIGNGASAIALTNDLIYNDTDRGSTVNIYGGAFSSEKNIDNDAVWCGCSADTLNIYGGTFSGRRYGINVSEGRVNIDRDSAVISGWTAQINGNINWV